MWVNGCPPVPTNEYTACVILALSLACAPPETRRSEISCSEAELLDDAGLCVPAACGTAAFVEGADVELAAGERIAEAADALGSGTLALAAGTWAETLDFGERHAGIVLAGRCRELVVIDGSGGEASTVKIDGGGVTLRDLTITGGQTAGVIVGDGAATFTRVALDHNRRRGLLARGDATVFVDDLAITNTVAGDDDSEGAGLDVDGSATLTGRNLLLDGNWRHGIVVSGGSIDVTGLTVARSVAPEVSANAGGIEVTLGAHLTASQVLIEGNALSGLSVFGIGSVVSLTHCVIRDGTAGPDRQTGFGAEVWERGTLSLTDCALSNNRAVGILVDGSTLSLTDTVIADTASPGRGNVYGAGIGIQGGATVTMERVTVSGSRFAGIGMDGSGTTLVAQDLVVTGVQPAPDGLGGGGVSMNDHALFTGQRITIEETHQAGISMENGAIATLREGSIRRVRSDDSRQNGLGGVVTGGASLTLTEFVIDDVQQIGLGAAGASSTLTLESVVVRNVGPANEEVQGHGVELHEGASLVASRLSVEHTIGGGIAIDGGSAILRDVRVSENTADARGGGAAVEVSPASSLDAENLVLADNVGVGIVVNGAGAVASIRHTTISGTRTSPAYASAAGVVAEAGALVTLADAHISDTHGVGIVATDGASAACNRCQLQGNAFAGAAAVGGNLDLTDTVVRDTLPNASWGGGIGVYARAEDRPAGVRLDRVHISDNPWAAVWLDGETAADIVDSTLIGGAGVDLRTGLTAHGNALYAHQTTAWNGISGVRVQRTTLGPSADAGVLLESGSASFSDILWVGNPTDVVQQRCADDPVPTDLSGASSAICPVAEWLTLPLRYDFFLVDPDASSD